jgi:hypothetical protein
MPGVSPPNNEKFFALLGGMQKQLQAMSTQQQQAITNALGQVIINIGLVPGSDPARYGIQFLDPSSGTEIAFLGEGTSAALSLLLANDGSLTMKSTAGTTVLYAGQAAIPDGSGRLQEVFELYRDDGSIALALGDFGTVYDHAHQQALQWYDRSGRIVLADDTTSAHGLAAPHLATSGTLVNTNTSTWPATTSSGFTTIANGEVELHNPKLKWTITLMADSGVTAEFQMLINGTQIGTTQTVTSGFSTWTATNQSLGGLLPGGTYLVELQAKVTAGSGSARAQCLQITGDQS